MKVFIYERVSSEEQAKHGYSLDAQHEALTDFCDKNDHVVLGVYKDEGISARKPYTKRPAMVQLLQDIETVKPQMVLFTKLDRWFRNIKEYYKVQDILEQNNVYWKAINEEYDTSTASGRLYVNIKLSIAQDEADRTSERIKDVQSQLITQGKVLGGGVPFGYKIEDKRLVFDDNIRIVKDAVDHYLTHQNANLTTRHINDLYGLQFNHVRLMRLLKNPLLKGEYKGNTAFCEPLLTNEEWNRLQGVINRNVKSTPSKRVYIFSGLIRCSCCGRLMTAYGNTQRNYYRCQYHFAGLCDMTHNINEKKMESWLLDNIEEDFKVNVSMKPKKKTESPQKYKDRLKRLNDIYLMGNISENQYRSEAKALNEKIAELSKTEPQKEISFTKDWKEVYQMLDAEHRRSFWRNIIKEVRVDKDGEPQKIVY